MVGALDETRYGQALCRKLYEEVSDVESGTIEELGDVLKVVLH